MKTLIEKKKEAIIATLKSNASNDKKLPDNLFEQIKEVKDHNFLVDIGKTLAPFIKKKNFTNSFKSFLIDKLPEESDKKTILATALFKVLNTNNTTENVGRLLELGNGIDFINVTNKNQKTALHKAALYGHKKIVQLLLQNNASIDFRTNDGFTALMIAALNGHKEIVQILLENNASPDLKNNKGATALIYAALYGHKEIVKELIEGGANLSLQNDEGQTPLDIAKTKGDDVYSHIIDIIAINEIKTQNVYTLPFVMGNHTRLGSNNKVLQEMLNKDDITQEIFKNIFKLENVPEKHREAIKNRIATIRQESSVAAGSMAERVEAETQKSRVTPGSVAKRVEEVTQESSVNPGSMAERVEAGRRRSFTEGRSIS